MKRYFLLLTVLSFSLLFEAKEVSYDEALTTASKFFAPASSKKQVKALKEKLSLATTFNQTEETDKPAFYVINNGNNGFVIVSADDNAQQILGYSNEAAFDANQIPDHVRFWLQRYAEEITYLAKNNTPKPLYATSPTYEEVKPLLGNIEHSQLTPYNNFCPNKYPAGCVATAGSQIMKYWKHPEHGNGTVTYTPPSLGTELTANLSQSTYNWEKILDKYTTGNYNDAQADAIALLMRDIGYAVNMDYEGAGSSSSEHDMAVAFVDNFGYDKSLHRLPYEESLNGESWHWAPKEDILYDILQELKAKRPVFCTALTPEDENGNKTGHAFVCDGMQADGKLHINWGWDGLYNGYFEMTNFTPGTGGTGAGTGNYTKGITFLTHIQPNQGTTELSQSWGVGDLDYVPETNEFTKTDETEFALFIDDDENNTAVFSLNSVPTMLYFGYSIFKNSDCISAAYARWGAFEDPSQISYYDGVEIGVNRRTGYNKLLDVDPQIKINNLVDGVPVGAYDLYLSMLSSPTSKIGHPVYVKNRGKVKHKIAISKTKAYIYPASTNYNRTNNPTQLQETPDGDTYTLSWSGNAAEYLLLVWNEDDLTVEKVSGTTKSGIQGDYSWAVVACEQQGSVTYATSDIVNGGVIDGIASAVEQVQEKVKPTIKVASKTIDIQVDKPTDIVIYNANGILVYSARKATQASFDVGQVGVYFVRVGTEPYKILVK